MPSRPPVFAPPYQPPKPQRMTAQQRGYDAEWNQAARAYRAKHPHCLGCYAVGRTAAATVVDHIVPHRGHKRLFWDRANWQSACAFHHDVVKRRIEERYLRGQASKADLRLDSPMAQRLTRDLTPR